MSLILPPVLVFPRLAALGSWLRHAFVLRDPAVNVEADRATALERLQAGHLAVAASLGFLPDHVALAEQVHGAEVAVVGAGAGGMAIPGVDGLVTGVKGQALGIHVADCGAVFVVDPVRRVVALVHSGRKGSELGIVGRAIGLMSDRFGSEGRDLVIQLSPCIRPPHYEVDFAARIRADAHERGVPLTQIVDDRTCTASDPGRFYSYRAERGRTGRMFAILGLAADRERVD